MWARLHVSCMQRSKAISASKRARLRSNVPSSCCWPDTTPPFPGLRRPGWFYSQMRLWGQLEREEGQLARAMGSFRTDLYIDALQGTAHSARPDMVPHPEAGAFFDSRPFDVTAIETYLESFLSRRSHA